MSPGAVSRDLLDAISVAVIVAASLAAVFALGSSIAASLPFSLSSTEWLLCWVGAIIAGSMLFAPPQEDLPPSASLVGRVGKPLGFRNMRIFQTSGKVIRVPPPQWQELAVAISLTMFIFIATAVIVELVGSEEVVSSGKYWYR